MVAWRFASGAPTYCFFAKLPESGPAHWAGLFSFSFRGLLVNPRKDKDMFPISLLHYEFLVSIYGEQAVKPFFHAARIW